MIPVKIYSFFSISLIIFIFTSYGIAQNRQAYLTINTDEAKITCDSLFVASLKKEVKNALIQKNIILRNNDEVEKADSSYLYINIVISDSLFLSAKKLSNNDVYVAESRYNKKAWNYTTTDEIRNYVLNYIEGTF